MRGQERRDPDRREAQTIKAPMSTLHSQEDETPKIRPADEDCCGQPRSASAERAYWIGISALVLVIVLSSLLAALLR